MEKEPRAHFKHPSRPGDCQVCDGVGINVLMLPIPLTSDAVPPHKPRPVPTRCRWCHGTGYQKRAYPNVQTFGARPNPPASPTLGYNHNSPRLGAALAQLLRTKS